MSNVPNDKFYCPKCKNPASVIEPICRHHMQRIQLMILFCHDCQLIYIDKTTIKKIIKEWNTHQNFPLKQLYGEFFGELKESVDFYVSRGYKNIRFLKNINKLSP